MTPTFAFLLGAGIGLVAGLVIGFYVRRKAESSLRGGTTAESDLEIARLNERVSALTNELAQNLEASKSIEAQCSDLRTHLSESQSERVRIEERAARIPSLESEISSSNQGQQQLSKQLADAREKGAAADAILKNYSERISSLESEVSTLRTGRDGLLSEQEQLKTQLAEFTTLVDMERKQATERLAFIGETKEEFATRFRVLANDILEEKTKRFTETNQINIGQILEPLRAKIQEFQGKVEQFHLDDSVDRSALAQQVRQLVGLNQQLSQDANNLAEALKGTSKTQGNWGELVLERILEASGLRKGHEYDVRESYPRGEGLRGQPDVVLHLPENKHLVLDSKVSLKAYDTYCSAAEDGIRAESLKRHIDSVRKHIRDLSSQEYQNLDLQWTLDFVIMFVPIEPAYIVALSQDDKLWEEAWKKNVLLVGPSTLLFVLRTVAHLWRQERQNQNVQEIVKRGADLYDKLCGFVESLTDVGRRLDQARESYENAHAKLSSGRGNVIRQAEALKSLGVKPSKSLPQEIVEAATEEPFQLPESTEV